MSTNIATINVMYNNTVMPFLFKETRWLTLSSCLRNLPIFLKLSTNGTFVGMKEISVAKQNIRCYPNPTRGLIRMDVSGYNVTKIKIADAIGREVYPRSQLREGELELDMSEQQSGIYILTCEVDNNISITNRIIIN